MERKVVIVHGCPPDVENAKSPETRSYDKHWMPWLAKELTARGFKVVRPLMPNPWAPVYEAFREEFEKTPVSENDILIGHSCGGAFLVRWLGDTKQKVAKLILVAPWKIPDEGDEGRKAYYEYPIDETIPSRVGEVVMFTSDDEEAEGKESVKIFHDALGGNLIELQKHGHFTFGDMKTEEFPGLLEEVLG